MADEKDVERQRSLLGLEALPEDIQAFFKKNPKLRDEIMGERERNRREFELLQKQTDVMLKLEKDRISILEKTGQPVNPDPAIMAQISSMQERMRNLLQGASDEELESLRQQESKVTLGDPEDPENTVQIGEAEFFDMVENPSKAKTAFDQLISLGKGNLANQFAQMIADNLGSRLTNQVQSPLTQPTPEGQRFGGGDVENPLATGAAGTPEENIRRNIRQSLTSGTERVGEISSALKGIRDR